MSILTAPARPGTALAVYMAALGVKTAALAEAVMVNPDYLSGIKTGHRRPSRRLRRSIAEALSVGEDLLFPAIE